VPASLTLSAALLSWGERTRRDLPWRRTRDPWAVMVSELMLQQTQVSRVVPKWEAFMAAFPTVADCAAAPAAEVVRLWSGLGYNRRALHLHRCATDIVIRHEGRVPNDLVELMALPGLGPYTARAVLAFAYGHDVGVLDTNAGRVLARAVAGRRLAGAEAQHLADSLVPGGHGWGWNQAVLDLGATVCTARLPGCPRCPVRSSCRWHADGQPLPDPALGSAATSRGQSRFAGSDRQGRGRLVATLRLGPIATSADALALACGWPDDVARAARIVEQLINEGMAVIIEEGRVLTLPGQAPRPL
jgi:A/G-specific adenine glycosylase